MLFALLCSSTALAGRNSMIPPGQEQRIREFVDAAIAAARAAAELPQPLDETVDIHIDRDRIRVVVHPLDAAGPSELPTIVVFHPDAVPDDAAGALAPGVVLRCGPPGAQRECESDEAEPWRPLAGHIAAARAPVADLVWQVEEEHGPAPPPDVIEDIEVEQRRGMWVDRGVAMFAIMGGLALAVFGVRRGRGRAEAVGALELLILLALVLAFVGATLQFTAMLPLHEHNSFIARSDCAVDPQCTNPPASAWNLTTTHVYGLLLSAVPYRARALAGVSLGCSVVGLVLLWALGRTLMRALGRVELGPLAGLTAVAVVVTHPVAWRLAGSATFWPWSIAWLLAAALAGVWAGLSIGDADRSTRIAGALAWVVAAGCLAIVCGGNYVLLTMGTCLGLGPLCWSPAGRAWPDVDTRWRSAALRAVWIGVPALGLFAAAMIDDYALGIERAFGEHGIDDSITWQNIRGNFRPLLLDDRVSTRVWMLPLAACLLWLLAGVRVLGPLLYAWIVPGMYLGLAAGEIIGSGYPVGFINHHWDLWLSALGAGLGLAWIVAALERMRPLADMLPLPRALTWSRVLAGLAVALALRGNVRAKEGWRMATGERVLERELVALELAFTQLPEHDLLIVPPQLLAPTTDAPTQWDLLEVSFPRGFYNYAMRERGLEPAMVVELDRWDEPKPGERVLFYLGSSLRSFQPHEIAAGAVSDDLERPDVRALHDRFAFEPVYEFTLATDQHPQISQRLGADRVGEIGLGFYWLRPRALDEREVR